MLHTDTLIAEIRKGFYTTGWTLNRLAGEAGCFSSALRHFESDSWNPTAKTLRVLEQILLASDE